MALTTGEPDGLYLKVIDGLLQVCDKDGKPIVGVVNLEFKEGVDALSQATVTFFVAGLLE